MHTALGVGTIDIVHTVVHHRSESFFSGTQCMHCLSISFSNHPLDLLSHLLHLSSPAVRLKLGRCGTSFQYLLNPTQYGRAFTISLSISCRRDRLGSAIAKSRHHKRREATDRWTKLRKTFRDEITCNRVHGMKTRVLPMCALPQKEYTCSRPRGLIPNSAVPRGGALFDQSS